MRRLIILADGTWKSAESKTVTNVVFMRRAVALCDPSGIEQKVFYDAGVGTGNVLDKLSGGAFGAGLNDNIKDAYRFLTKEYQPGDEIYLFGFSRGAYTVRSTVGMIRKCGILKTEDERRLEEAFALYRKDHDSADHPEPRTFRERFCHPQARIDFLGVWDTVGALGIPLAGLRFLTRRPYQFHDTKLSKIVKRACHAVAVDERRGSFTPTLWEAAPDAGQVVEQSWFTGVHSDIGGGYDDRALADITFTWMAQRAAATGLSFDAAFLRNTMRVDFDQQLGFDDDRYRGELHNSRTFLYWFMLAHDRVIGSDASHCESVWHTAPKRVSDKTMKYNPKNLVSYLTRPTRIVQGPAGFTPGPPDTVNV